MVEQLTLHHSSDRGDYCYLPFSELDNAASLRLHYYEIRQECDAMPHAINQHMSLAIVALAYRGWMME